VIERYATHKTAALTRIAEALMFVNRADYEQCLLVRIAADADLKERLRQKLGSLATALTDHAQAGAALAGGAA
jgi:hypothetical protein